MNIHQDKIYNYLLTKIMSGDLALNARIPTETELGNLFNTTRMNAHRAIKKLEAFGILWRNKGQGTIVHQVPSSIATGELKSLNTRRICILNNNTPETREIHWNDRMIKAFYQVTDQHNTEVVYKDISHITTYNEYSDFTRKVAEEGYNALIIVGNEATNTIMSQHPEVFFEFHNNVFIFGRGSVSLYDWPYSVVAVNPFGEGLLVAEHLIREQYNHITYFCFNKDAFWKKERERGLQFGLRRGSEGKIKHKLFNLNLNLKADIDRTLDFGPSKEKTAELLQILMKTKKKSAIVAANDEIAVFVYDVAHKHNITPGKDFGLIGFDDNPKYKDYNLTSVSPPLETIGKKLAELVIQKLDSKNNKEFHSIRIDSELIRRDTC